MEKTGAGLRGLCKSLYPRKCKITNTLLRKNTTVNDGFRCHEDQRYIDGFIRTEPINCVSNKRTIRIVLYCSIARFAQLLHATCFPELRLRGCFYRSIRWSGRPWLGELKLRHLLILVRSSSSMNYTRVYGVNDIQRFRCRIFLSSRESQDTYLFLARIRQRGVVVTLVLYTGLAWVC